MTPPAPQGVPNGDADNRYAWVLLICSLVEHTNCFLDDVEEVDTGSMIGSVRHLVKDLKPQLERSNGQSIRADWNYRIGLWCSDDLRNDWWGIAGTVIPFLIFGGTGSARALLDWPLRGRCWAGHTFVTSVGSIRDLA